MKLYSGDHLPVHLVEHTVIHKVGGHLDFQLPLLRGGVGEAHLGEVGVVRVIPKFPLAVFIDEALGRVQRGF